MTELLLTRKRIDIDASPVLHARPLSARSLAEDWEAHSSSREYCDRAFWDRNPHPSAGVVRSIAWEPRALSYGPELGGESTATPASAARP